MNSDIVWEHHFASLWNSHLKLIVDDDICSIFEYTMNNRLVLIEFESLVQSVYALNKSPTDCFNSCSYDTFFGNFAFGIYVKIASLYSFHRDSLFSSYIYILFIARYKYNVDLSFKNYYNLTPLEEAMNDNALNILDIHLGFRLLVRLLNPKYCIVTKCQSVIRRWLCRNIIVHKKFQKCLESILLAPSQQIEFRFFPTFPGGSLYLDTNSKYQNYLMLRSGKRLKKY